jgi:hypothetical protein
MMLQKSLRVVRLISRLFASATAEVSRWERLARGGGFEVGPDGLRGRVSGRFVAVRLGEDDVIEVTIELPLRVSEPVCLDLASAPRDLVERAVISVFDERGASAVLTKIALAEGAVRLWFTADAPPEVVAPIVLRVASLMGDAALLRRAGRAHEAPFRA